MKQLGYTSHSTYRALVWTPVALRIPSLAALLLCLAWQTRLHAAEPGPAFQVKKHVIDPDFPGISATATDVDGDGRLDVVAAGGPSGGPSPWSRLVYWYRAPDWTRLPVCALDEKAIILHIEAAAFLGPTSASYHARTSGEIVITDGQLGKVWWYRYNRDRTNWTGTVIVDDVQYAHGSANGDIDNDGFADLLVPTQHGTPRQGLLWARNPGAPGKPWEKCPLSDAFKIGGWQHYVRLVDLNGDGRLDALHGSDGDPGWFGYWLQPERPTSPWEVHALSGPMRKGTNLDAADLDGDHKPDLVASEGHGTGLWWFAAPAFEPRRLDDTLKSPHFLALADFDHNGTVDVASCGYESRTLAFFLNDGKGSFQRQVVDTNQCAYDGQVADLDQDGDPDLLVAGQNSTNIVWYENLSGPASPPR